MITKTIYLQRKIVLPTQPTVGVGSILYKKTQTVKMKNLCSVLFCPIKFGCESYCRFLTLSDLFWFLCNLHTLAKYSYWEWSLHKISHRLHIKRTVRERPEELITMEIFGACSKKSNLLLKWVNKIKLVVWLDSRKPK